MCYSAPFDEEQSRRFRMPRGDFSRTCPNKLDLHLLLRTLLFVECFQHRFHFYGPFFQGNNSYSSIFLIMKAEPSLKNKKSNGMSQQIVIASFVLSESSLNTETQSYTEVSPEIFFNHHLIL